MSVPLRITTYYKDEPHAVVAGIAVGGPTGTHIDIVRFNRGIYESNKKKLPKKYYGSLLMTAKLCTSAVSTSAAALALTFLHVVEWLWLTMELSFAEIRL